MNVPATGTSRNARPLPPDIPRPTFYQHVPPASATCVAGDLDLSKMGTSPQTRRIRKGLPPSAQRGAHLRSAGDARCAASGLTRSPSVVSPSSPVVTRRHPSSPSACCRRARALARS